MYVFIRLIPPAAFPWAKRHGKSESERKNCQKQEKFQIEKRDVVEELKIERRQIRKICDALDCEKKKVRTLRERECLFGGN